MYAIIRDLPSLLVSLAQVPSAAQSELSIRARFQSDLLASVIVDSKKNMINKNHKQ